VKRHDAAMHYLSSNSDVENLTKHDSF